MKYLKFATGLAIMLLLASGFIAAQSLHVKVFNVSGEAEYLAAGKADWQKMKSGISLYSGDSIKTHENASVDIAFDKQDRNIVTIRPDTYVVLLLSDREKIKLISGEIFSRIKSLPRGSQFEVRTPTAVVGARGTGWGTRAGKKETVVSSYEGSPYTKGIKRDGTPMDEEVIVRQGYKTTVEAFKKPSKLMRISDRNMQNWNSWKQGVTERISAARGAGVKQKLIKAVDKIDTPRQRVEKKKDVDRTRAKEEATDAGRGKPERTTTTSRSSY